MMWRATNDMINQLLAAPEHGLGYQFVTYRRQGEWHEAIVLNAELILEEPSWEGKVELPFHGQSEMLSKVVAIHGIESFMVRRRGGGLASMVAEPAALNCGRSYAGGAALDALEQRLEADERFVRISAFMNDKRVDQRNRRLLPGSFATSLHDYSQCVGCKVSPHGDDPVDRYALPNPAPPVYAFHIIAEEGTWVQRGRAQPNFGHAGGGEEAYFRDGTSPGSLMENQPRPYGQ